MKYPWDKLTGFPKALVICIAVLLASGGLCGLQFALSNVVKSDTLSGILMIPGFFELIAFWGSALGIVISLIGWIATAIYRAITTKVSVEDNQR